MMVKIQENNQSLIRRHLWLLVLVPTANIDIETRTKCDIFIAAPTLLDNGENIARLSNPVGTREYGNDN
jgi:hypothetical protein